MSEIAEFHKRCGGRVVNFKESDAYSNITEAVCISKSNCFNAGFGNIRPVEAQVMATLVAHYQPKKIFEIGTFNGFSTLHLECNAPDGAEIFTLDLPPDKSNITLKNDLNEAHRDIKNINLNEQHYFHSKKGSDRITELFGDSMTFDFSPYYNKMDFIFIDANHSYGYVKADTENAFKMLAPNGVISMA